MKDKRAILGGAILMIPRLLLITFIAFIILGASSIFYAYYIDVRGVEARIMTREVVNCVAPGGVADLNKFGDTKFELLNYCGFDENEVERFFVRVIVKDSGGEEILKLVQGDSGALWVRELFDSGVKLVSEEAGKYRPGYFKKTYPLKILDGGEGNMEVEVLVSNEF
jgi:hypothetical protein|tara:strand:+ start:172 stop:672 length:501 start_codon:yes stop_codon:yes gene_type:complete